LQSRPIHIAVRKKRRDQRGTASRKLHIFAVYNEDAAGYMVR
jgi:hypothetical protein